MAIRKSDMDSSLYQLCDALRGGMDPSQYKDYVLTLVFVKYITDKFLGQKYAPIKIPSGCSFEDFKALRNTSNIGEDIDKALAKLANEPENQMLKGMFRGVHFNDDSKIGKGKEMVDKLTKLIDIFCRPEFDFSRNKASGDDILGDVYENLMKHFAVDSGKSKGQFYTPPKPRASSPAFSASATSSSRKMSRTAGRSATPPAARGRSSSARRTRRGARSRSTDRKRTSRLRHFAR